MVSLVLRKIYRKRQDWSRKGDFGKLLVVGGSALYSGSPMFNALAAYRAGCDLVRIAAPEEAAEAIKAYLPDLIAYPLEGDYLNRKHVKSVLAMQKDADAMVIGGGLCRSKPVLQAIRLVLKKTNVPTVVDADAIHAVNFRLKKTFLLTPHSHEFYILSGRRMGKDVQERKAAVKAAAKKLGCVVLLKGHVDVISDGRRVAENRTGNAYMTKGGFGDTLAGIAGALLAREVSSYDAACAAAYINGRAGDLAAKRFGEGTMASDLLWSIPQAIKGLGA